MKKLFSSLIIIFSLLCLIPTGRATPLFGEKYCHQPDFSCIKVKSGDTWEKLFPRPDNKNLVRRVNRMNTPLRQGMIIAVPHHLDSLSLYDISPFPRDIGFIGEKIIYVNQSQQAWGAYDESGSLVWWGPISSGLTDCTQVYGGCKTPMGEFRIVRKQDIDCISSTFPQRANGNNGGAPMPYCMHFFRGFALHGSPSVPGYPASHGCIRLFIEDAQWLNQEFIDLPGGGFKGTRIVID